MSSFGLKRRHLKKKLLYVLPASILILLVIYLVGGMHRRYQVMLTRKNRPSLPTFVVNKVTNRFRHGCYERGKIKEHKKLLPADTLRELGCKKRPPGAIVFGVKKGGTTALKEFLAFHPEITVTPKELQFLSNYSLANQGVLKYKSLMPFSLPNQVAVEKTPGYFARPKCAERLSSLIPDCKLIAVMSDPVYRAISDYLHIAWRRDHDFRGAEELTAEHQDHVRHYEVAATFPESVLFPNGSIKTWNTLIDTGLYYKHAKIWHELFPPENFLYLDGKELITNPVKSLQQVEDFLGLSPFFSDEVFHFNETKGFYCIQHPVYSCMPPAKGRRHPAVDESVIKTLQKYFEPSNRQFSKLVRKRFSWTTYSGN